MKGESGWCVEGCMVFKNSIGGYGRMEVISTKKWIYKWLKGSLDGM